MISWKVTRENILNQIGLKFTKATLCFLFSNYEKQWIVKALNDSDGNSTQVPNIQ